MVRVKIFSLRNEILSAMTSIINIINENPMLTNEASYLTIDKRIQLSNVFAQELLRAVKEGMTIRTLKEYLYLLEALAVPWVITTEFSSSLSLSSYFLINNYSSAHNTSHILQEVLSYVDSSQSTVFKNLINVMMMYATRLDGLIKCEDIAINIIFTNDKLVIPSNNDTMNNNDNNDDVVASNGSGMNCVSSNKKIAASSLAADTILGELLKYIDGILRDEISRKSSSSSSLSSSLRQSNKQSNDKATAREVCNRICKLAFRLLDYSNDSTSVDDDDDSTTKQPTSLLQLLSDKRKNQVLILFSRIVSRCIKETSLLHKVMQQIQIKNIKKDDNENWNNSSDDDEHDENGGNGNDEKRMTEIKLKFDNTINSVDFLIAIIVGISPTSFDIAKDIITDTINYRPTNQHKKVASSVIKRAHALGFKVEELQWRLLHLLQEIDKHKKNNFNFERDISTIDSDLTIPFLAEGFNIIDSAGYEMLQSILQTHDDSNNDDNMKNIKSSKKKRRKTKQSHRNDIDDDDDNDIDIDEEESIDEDEDDDDDDDEEEEDDDDDDNISPKKVNRFPLRNTAALLSSSSRKSKAKRMRSRNRVIDEWLDVEDGDDTYADIVDFVV
jgi:hypothetical protein